MAYQVLYRKWRPKSFSDVVGQEATVKVLQNSLTSQNLHHAYLFTGTRGVGKTTIARILASALVCQQGISDNPCNTCHICHSVINSNSVDVIEIDAASKTKVEDTRAVLENLAYAPNIARFRIYIIDEVHMLSSHSFNALLKTLEEPPGHVKFLLATTDPQKLPITVLSRCLQFKLNTFTTADISKYLGKILTQENQQFEPQALWQIALAAKGSIRDSLSLLEQVVAFSQDLSQITYQNTCKVLGVPDYVVIIELLTAIIKSNPASDIDNNVSLIITIIENLFNNNLDPYIVLQEIQMMLKNITILQLSPNSLSQQQLMYKDLLLQIVEQATLEEIQLYYEIAVKGFKDLAFMPDIQVGFEMIMLRMVAFKPVNIVNKLAAQDLSVKISDGTEQNSGNNISKFTKKEQIFSPKIEANIATANVKLGIDADIGANIDKSNSNNIINKNNFITVINKLNLAGLTKQLAEHLVFDSINQEQINLLVNEDSKILITEHNTNNLQKAFSKYLNQQIKVIIKTKDFKQYPELEQQTIKWQKQLQKQEFMTSNKEIEQLAGHFDGHIEEIQL
jgi:DNA polymerase-3 subunit gamma/tau